MSELKCSVHKSYRGLRKPRSGCEECLKIYETNRENGIKEPKRAPRRSKAEIAAAVLVAHQSAEAVVDSDEPVVDEEVAVDPSCCGEDEVEVNEATYDDVLEQFKSREG
jgi:hypothetical protein